MHMTNKEWNGVLDKLHVFQMHYLSLLYLTGLVIPLLKIQIDTYKVNCTIDTTLQRIRTYFSFIFC